ncbi:MAG: class I SAM-dependent rRNA methyltransferase [Planctomycetota bacterium]|nr:class I SAM-dependent rRNA methyltransferase [Planctomycetota bacterium]
MKDIEQTTESDRPVVSLGTHPSPHPFIRRGLIKEAPSGLSNGYIVRLVSNEGVELGDAFWSNQSDIAARLLTPPGVPFDRSFLRAALDRAVTLRENMAGLTDGTEAFRVVHAEGDGLSGLVVDRLGDVLSGQLFSAGWKPYVEDILELLHGRLGTHHHVFTMDSRVARLEGVKPFRLESEDLPEQMRIVENGARYHIDLSGGHKTGFFCDQRENRRDLVALTEGKDLLDLCCHSGGFGVAAAVTGSPNSVTAVDLDEEALALARRNANTNQAKISFIHADAFDWARQVEKTGRRFDVVVLDPPKFIPTRRDEGKGESQYRDLNRLAMALVADGGLLLTCSCSGLLSSSRFRELLTSAGRRAGKIVRIIRKTGAGPDHPVALECPESEYLTAFWMQVEDSKGSRGGAS